MHLSIIIPTLNEAGFLDKTLKVLTTHANHPIEILVVDGGSTDATATIAQKFPVTWLPAPAKGRAIQMNYGAAHASGDVLFFLHADCIPPEHFYKHIQKAIDAGSQAGSFRYRFDKPGLLLRLQTWFIRFPGLLFRGGDQGLFITKKLFDTIGGYREEFVVMEDYDIIRRIKKHAKPALLPQHAIVSARKYACNNWLQVQIANAVAMTMFLSGRYSPVRIQSTYYRLIRHPKAD